MAGEYSLSVILSAQDRASNVVSGFLSNLGPVGGVVAGVAATLVGVGAASIKMAGDFQSGMTSLVTGAGESQSNLKMVSDGILSMAVSTGTSTKLLTDGMYMVESAGYHGADGLKVLQTAAQGAKVGNADLGTTANALTTILTDYHMKSSQAASAMNGLITTVASGKTHLQDLAGAMGSVLPLASSLNVSFPQVGGAIATMTNAGMSAQNASHNLANAMRALSAPGGVATKALTSVGLSAQQVSNDLSSKGLAATMQEITDAVGKKFPAGSEQAKAALKSIMGGATGLNVALMLGGKNMSTFKGNIDSISGSMSKGGNSVNGFNLVQGTFNFKMQQAQESTETMMIKLGQYLMPIVEKVGGSVAGFVANLANWVTTSGAIPAIANGIGTALSGIGNVIGGVASGIGSMVHWFQQGSAPAQILKVALEGVAAGLALMKISQFVATLPGLITQLGVWAAGQWTVAAASIATALPYILIGILVVGVITLIVLAVQHWGEIAHWLQGVWAGFSSWFHSALGAVGNFFKEVWDGILKALKAVWNGIVNAVKIGAELVLAVLFAPIIAVVALFAWLYNHNTYFKRMIDAIVNAVKVGIAWLQGAWQAVITWIVGLWNGLVGFATALWNKVSATIKAEFFAAIAYVQAIWNTISSFFVNAWNAYIAGPLHTLWTNVSNVFSNAWNAYIATPLNNIWKSVSKWFTDLGTGAANSGKNFINMLVQGIQNGAGAIWNAVTGIASNIWKALGFHSPPPAGPAADSDTWMPNLITMLSTGLIAGMPKIQAAVNTLAQPLTAMSAPSLASTVSNVTSGAPNLTGAPNVSSTSNNNNGTTVINLTINSQVKMTKDLIREIDNGLAQLYRSSGLTVNTPSGRRY